MTEQGLPGLDARRRKLRFRCWHRGVREMDLLMGRFADACLAGLDATELDDLERLIDVPDPELYVWIVSDDPPPGSTDTPLLRRLRAFHRGSTMRA